MTEEENQPKEPQNEQELYELLTSEIQVMLRCIPEAMHKYKHLIDEGRFGDFYLDLLASGVAGAMHGTFPEDQQENAVIVVQRRIGAVSKILRGKDEDDESAEIIVPDQKIIGS